MEKSLDKPRRRWFRYSLRTLLVLVVLLAIPLGWIAAQLKWIHDRHEALEHHHALSVSWTGRGPEAPWSVRIFGENGQLEITLRDDKSDDERKRIEKLFPEATVRP